MKILLRRDQKASMLGMGSIAFILDIRAELSEEEMACIKKYKLGSAMLYERDKLADPCSGLLGLLSRFIFRARNMSLTVDELTSGKTIECKDIVEMLDAEEQLRQACKTFKAILTAAASFGGEEVLNLDD